ncbi:MAG: L-threonine 3-dehydrogenase [Pseudomonadota bacterium]
MKALVKASSAPGIDLQDVEIPEITEEDVLIKVRKTGICGTDKHIWDWDTWAQNTIPVPMVIGHEFSGEIVKIGRNVTSLKVGQRVSGEGHIVGTNSRASRTGRFHLDPETQGIGVNIPGAFAEYLRLPAFNVVPLPEHIDDDIGAILDPLGNAVHAALSFNLIGEDVLITGAGPIGIMAACVARHAGARHVVLTDIQQDRLELARSIVDITTVNVAYQNLTEVTKELGLKEGFDVGLEMSGASGAFDQMLVHMCMGGEIALLGIPTEKTYVDWGKIIFKALTLKGVYGREMFETWYKMISMLDSGLNIREIITHRYHFTEYEKGFDAMNSGTCGKVILHWT